MIDIHEITRFSNQIHNARVRASQGHDSTDRSSTSLSRLLEELDQAWEELVVAEEELRQQHDEVLTSRDALDAERRRYRWLFEFAPDPYIVTDRHGVVRDANKMALQMLGTTSSYITGKPLVIFVTRERRASFRTALSHAIQLQRMTDWDLELQPRQGAPLVAATTIAVMPGPGTAETELLWAMRDMTERRRHELERRTLAEELRTQHLVMQQEQERRLQAEEADRAKDAFLGMISHELRAPLTALIGWVELMARGALDESARRRALAVVERSAQAQVKLIDDLLDVSRMLSGKLQLERTPVDLAPVLADAVEMIRPTAEQAGLWLSYSCDAGAIPVIGDADRLRQVLLNLLSNAVKFSSTGGRIDVAVTHGTETVTVSVKDDGVGIAPEFLPRVFDRFSQAETGTSRTYKGLGLGLAIARHIVDKHDGTIRAESPGRGHGATFRFQLPLAR